jgi:hypothetical protein
MPMTEQGLAVLHQARQDILDHGSQFDMLSWVRMEYGIADPDYPDHLDGFQCDTIFCIAGAIVLIHGGVKLVSDCISPHYTAKDGCSICQAAADAIGVSIDYVRRLFFHEEWFLIDESLLNVPPTLDNALRAIDLFAALYSQEGQSCSM